MAAARKSKGIHLTRLYDAPVKVMWDAGVEDKQAAQWWGPCGFTVTTLSKEFKAGSNWRYVMHGPDGND